MGVFSQAQLGFAHCCDDHIWCTDWSGSDVWVITPDVTDPTRPWTQIEQVRPDELCAGSHASLSAAQHNPQILPRTGTLLGTDPVHRRLLGFGGYVPDADYNPVYTVRLLPALLSLLEPMSLIDAMLRMTFTTCKSRPTGWAQSGSLCATPAQVRLLSGNLLLSKPDVGWCRWAFEPAGPHWPRVEPVHLH